MNVRILWSAGAVAAATVLAACGAATTSPSTTATRASGSAAGAGGAGSSSSAGAPAKQTTPTGQTTPTSAGSSAATAPASTPASSGRGNGGSTASYTAISSDGFTFDVRIVQAPTLSPQQGDGTDPNYPSAPAGQDWVQVTADVRNPLTDRSVPLVDFLNATGDAINRTHSLGIAIPASDTSQANGQCVPTAVFQAFGAPAGFCYLYSNINFPDGSFFDPTLGGAPTIPAGGDVLLNFYSGPVAQGTSLAGTKIWFTSGYVGGAGGPVTWSFVPSP